MKYSSKKVRKEFIDFFIEKKHQFVRSAPVLPIGDPTLLFTNAGMNQFKDIFLEKKKPEFNRVVNSQKCIRVSGKHNDLEEVGVDDFHHTFFEMLGNWSFGDFYKKEAIEWSWELFTKVWKLDKDRLWVTVYKDDDESEELWKKNTDIDHARILRFGNKDNFWEMGETGPCGPCSEVHYYIGEDVNKQDKKGVNCEDEYRELWNLVFIEYNRQSDGTLENLPNKHVDTGMGLERIVSVLNKEFDHYQTDLFKPIVDHITKISKFDYTHEGGVPHRVISDHIRMICCSIADGVMPSNEGRGYVVRRVLRRACRFGRVLNINSPFLYQLVDDVIEILGDSYSELENKKTHLIKVIESEEVAFGRTLDRGLALLDEIIKSLDNKVIPGDEVFKLYDTFGFPVDLTQLIAKEHNCTLDLDTFEKHMTKQKDQARKSHKFKDQENQESWETLSNRKESNFIGYKEVKAQSKISKYRYKDDKLEIIMEKTPFYAESGGQIGDIGLIESDKISLKVVDTYKIGNDNCHLCILKKGNIKDGLKDEFNLSIDAGRRNKIKSNHTATHLLHKALKTIIGPHIQQAGSLVADDKLRFDLTHYEKLTDNQINEIETYINNCIINNDKLVTTDESYDSAKKRGAEALFGEKYGDTVRVVNIEGISLELCGGTHVNRTGNIGLFKITSESALASGVRRIEALTGSKALEYVNSNISILNTIKNNLKCNLEDINDKISALINLSKENNNIQKELQLLKLDSIFIDCNPSFENNSIRIFQVEINSNIDPKVFVDNFLSKYNKQTIFLLGMKTKKPMIVLTMTKDLTANLNAGEIIKEIVQSIGSGGGGPKHFGTAGFNKEAIYNNALELINKYLKDLLND